MKAYIIISFCILSACSHKENKKTEIRSNDQIDAKRLIAIIADSSFSAFTELVNTINYSLIDSSITSEGEIFYSAEQPEETEDYLSVKMTKDHYVNYLNFLTYKKNLYQYNYGQK